MKVPGADGRLRMARKAKYKTATAAAEAMGVKVSTYVSHENGTRGFDDDAARYADFFGVNLDWLLRQRGPMKASADSNLDERLDSLLAELAEIRKQLGRRR